eukprot:CAMPEP_0204433830 /NCGR_PEP_ID=MMETSP0470-20130426/70358_1 /ASSEMBLY_ACC=CAM_ASM_000385 /TAXON_ID=2969 /ORGANISM="Oxyrrhis marina" /LENGTH=36 /DNA_ID= /DNA_START= /DNA_END= /DNA_ORIENTATION=
MRQCCSMMCSEAGPRRRLERLMEVAGVGLTACAVIA